MANKILLHHGLDLTMNDQQTLSTYHASYKILNFVPFICTGHLNQAKNVKTDGFCPVFIVMKYESWSNMLTMCDHKTCLKEAFVT